MTKPPPVDFTRTRAALAVYDAGWEDRAMLATAAHRRQPRQTRCAPSARRSPTTLLTGTPAIRPCGAQLQWICASGPNRTQPAPPPKATRSPTARHPPQRHRPHRRIPRPVTRGSQATQRTRSASLASRSPVTCPTPRSLRWTWDDGTDHSLTGDAPLPPTGPVAYRVLRAWYGTPAPIWDRVTLRHGWMPGARPRHHHPRPPPLDRACAAAEQRAEMMAGWRPTRHPRRWPRSCHATRGRCRRRPDPHPKGTRP